MGMFFKEKDIKELLERAFSSEKILFHSSGLIQTYHHAIGVSRDSLLFVKFAPLGMKIREKNNIPLNRIKKAVQNRGASGYAVEFHFKDGKKINFQSMRAIGFNMPKFTEAVVNYINENIDVMKEDQKANRGIEILIDVILRSDILNPQEHLEQAVQELNKAGEKGSIDLSKLIDDLLSCRNRKIGLAISIASELQSTPQLKKSINAVLEAGETTKAREGCEFSPEIFGDGKIGWSTGTYERIIKLASSTLDKLKETS